MRITKHPPTSTIKAKACAVHLHATALTCTHSTLAPLTNNGSPSATNRVHTAGYLY
ncbi:hypothetical protein M3J09_002558 [Ascochyta lentis]